MIIKSMARKQSSFGQLIDYLNKDSDLSGGTVFSRNLYADPMNSKYVEREFLKNHQLLAKRSNGNAMYHELISLEQNPNLSRRKTNQILKDLAGKYLAERAPNNIVFGRIHHDCAHPHIHLMISANAVRNEKRMRIDRARFSQIQVDLESYKIQHYPKLSQTRSYRIIGSSETVKLSNREAQQIHRTGKKSSKQQLAETVSAIFSQARSSDDLAKKLKAQGFKLYQRGKQVGLEPLGAGRRIRLKTLGLEKDYQLFLQKPENTQQTQQSDDRAKLLLRRREKMERLAENHLQEFEGEQS